MSAMADFWPKLPAPATPSRDVDADTGTLDDVVAMKTPAPKKPKKPAEVTETYVNIFGVSMSESFDDKYKTTLPPIMKASLASAVDASAKLTTTAAPEGFYLDGNIVLKRTSTGIAATLHMQMADWPNKSMFAFPSGNVKLEVPNPKRIDDDVNDAVRALISKILLSVIPEFEKRAK